MQKYMKRNPKFFRGFFSKLHNESKVCLQKNSGGLYPQTDSQNKKSPKRIHMTQKPNLLAHSIFRLFGPEGAHLSYLPENL